jgi:glycogen synthase
MRILMVAAEYAPLAKAGGLGDMVAALAGALAARGHEVKVVLPLYGDADRERHGLAPARSCRPSRAGDAAAAPVLGGAAATGPDVLLLENGAVRRAGVYGYAEAGELRTRCCACPVGAGR